MVMQATKVFGPQGINWGVEIIEERFDNGASILRPVGSRTGAPFKRSSRTVPAGITRACRVTDDAIAQLLKPRKDHVQQIDPGGVE
ncbi:hypothetical protein AN694_0207495 [Serratia marcescens]|uniref:Uncharacterized protein n=1 Tax=Serratia marcescens TaxID=615 RepID=A0A2F0PKL7_SERMA|nr:hypothetical protein AN694_0207495 [Serratia marcescens]OCO84638.1 hypothetical protein AN695_0215855 [Serratia marcescens]